MAVPLIIEAAEFEAVQALKTRRASQRQRREASVNQTALPAFAFPPLAAADYSENRKERVLQGRHLAAFKKIITLAVKRALN
jgi:hypothetical protein